MNLLTKLLFKQNGVAEATETFFLNLSNPVNATILDGQGVGTIQRNPIIPSVTVTRTTGKASLAVGFDATGTVSGYTTNPSHDLFYAWSFGDVAGETWAYGATVGLDKNAAFGPIAGHVFKSAGSFNWQCIIIDGRGNTATSSGTVTVSAWAEADTIYIANGTLPVSGVGGAGVGATYYNETTWSGVVSRWAANKRIMLKRGDTWACTSNGYIPDGCEINSYGTGTHATVTSSSANQCPFGNNTGANDTRVCNIQHTGPRSNIADSGTLHVTVTSPTNLLALNVISNGTTWGFLNGSGIPVNNVFIQDCNFLNHDSNNVSPIGTNICVFLTKGYGVFILGSSFDKAYSHTVRISGAKRLVIDSSNIAGPAQDLSVGSHALTIREIGNDSGVWSGEYTEDVVVSNCFIASERVQWTFHIHHTGPVWAGRFRRILVERNFIDADKLGFITEAGETLTFRSNIIKSNSWENAVILYNGNTATPDASPDPVGIQFYNNTIYSLKSGVFNAFKLGGSVTSISDTVIKNNLIYAPNATSPALIENVGTVTGTLESNNSSGAQMASTRPWATATPTTPTHYTPTGYALGAGVWEYRSQRDFFNTPITSPVDIGAIQV